MFVILFSPFCLLRLKTKTKSSSFLMLYVTFSHPHLSLHKYLLFNYNNNNNSYLLAFFVDTELNFFRCHYPLFYIPFNRIIILYSFKTFIPTHQPTFFELCSSFCLLIIIINDKSFLKNTNTIQNALQTVVLNKILVE